MASARMSSRAMPVDTFTGLVLGYEGSGFRVTDGPRPPGSPGPVADVHWAGAAMWIGGDAIMLAFIMIVVWMWSRDEHADSLGLGWLEAARRSRFEDLLGGQHAARATPGGEGEPPAAGRPGPVVAGRGGIDDDEHLAAYNAYLAQLNKGTPETGR
jgi:hypothetical protein